MAATSFLILVLGPILLFALFWRVDRSVADPDPADSPIDPREEDVLVSQIAAAERLRREASEEQDPEQKVVLTRLAREAEADVQRLRDDLEDTDAAGR